jgi:hypothetical protein
VFETDSAAARPCRVSTDTATPVSAVSSGMPAAASEARATASTANAISRPVTSLLPDPLDRDEKACPPGCTDSVLLSAASAMVLSASSVPASRPDALTRYWTVAIAVVPSLVTRCDFCGGKTAATCGAAAAFDSAWLIAAALAVLVTVVPPRAAKTSWALVPPAAGKSVFTWSSAVCDGEPGMVKVLSSWPPPIFMPAPAAASTTSQTATTSHLRAKHARPIRYRTPDI